MAVRMATKMALFYGLTVSMCLVYVNSSRLVTVNTHKKNLPVSEENFYQILGLGADERLVRTNEGHVSVGDTLGVYEVKFVQYFRNIEVYGTHLVAELSGNAFTGWSYGVLARSVQQDISKKESTPNLPVEKAVSACVKQSNIHDDHVYNTKAMLFVFAGTENGTPTKARLIYLASFLFKSAFNFTRPCCKVDALTGDLFDSWESPWLSCLKTSGLQTKHPIKRDTTGEISDDFVYHPIKGPGGNTKVGRYMYGETPGKPLLQTSSNDNTLCWYRSPKIVVYTVVNVDEDFYYIDESRVDCKNGTSDEINGSFSPTNDAYYYGNVTLGALQYYLKEVPVPSLPQPIVVHYPEENAFWTGEYIVLGDGGNYSYSYATQDVIAHEIGHAFINKHAMLEYRMESGGMNEAFADMCAIAVQYKVSSNTNFQLGRYILKVDRAFRYLCDPTKDGRSIDHYVDYKDGLNVHYSSGIYNKAFCLLSKTNGWNVEKAFTVFADAVRMYWGPTTGFKAGVCGVVKATERRGLRISDVTSAFAQVGLYCNIALMAGCNGA